MYLRKELELALPLPLPTEAPGYSADLEGLVKWLSEQDPATWYDWGSISDCALCRFSKALTGSQLSFDRAVHALTEWSNLNRGGDIGYILIPLPRTYGAALTRARALLSAANSGRAGW